MRAKSCARFSVARSPAFASSVGKVERGQGAGNQPGAIFFRQRIESCPRRPVTGETDQPYPLAQRRHRRTSLCATIQHSVVFGLGIFGAGLDKHFGKPCRTTVAPGARRANQPHLYIKRRRRRQRHPRMVDAMYPDRPHRAGRFGFRRHRRSLPRLTCSRQRGAA